MPLSAKLLVPSRARPVVHAERCCRTGWVRVFRHHAPPRDAACGGRLRSAIVARLGVGWWFVGRFFWIALRTAVPLSDLIFLRASFLLVPDRFPFFFSAWC